jgi:hypothetical protein
MKTYVLSWSLTVIGLYNWDRLYSLWDIREVEETIFIFETGRILCATEAEAK